jgi:hypothetical protein
LERPFSSPKGAAYRHNPDVDWQLANSTKFVFSGASISSARRHAARHRTFLIPRTAPNAPPKPAPHDAFRRRPAREALRDDGMGMLKIGKKLGIGTSVVQRVVSEDAR